MGENLKTIIAQSIVKWQLHRPEEHFLESYKLDLNHLKYSSMKQNHLPSHDITPYLNIPLIFPLLNRLDHTTFLSIRKGWIPSWANYYTDTDVNRVRWAENLTYQLLFPTEVEAEWQELLPFAKFSNTRF